MSGVSLIYTHTCTCIHMYDYISVHPISEVASADHPLQTRSINTDVYIYIYTYTSISVYYICTYEYI